MSFVGLHVESVAVVAILLSSRLVVADEIFSKPTAEDIPALIQSLGDPNVQLGASRALVSLKGFSVDLLIAALKSESSETRIWAAYTLGKIGHPAATAVRKLAAILSKASSSHERGVAARSLGQIATAKSAENTLAVGALVAGLSDTDDRVRVWSATSLGRIRSSAQETIPRLVRAFADEPVREAAQQAVVRFGNVAVPTLVEALNDDTIRLEAAHALRRIDASAARKEGVDRPSRHDLPALKIALHSETKNAKARIKAAQQLGEIGVDAAPILIAAFSDNDEQVARAAVAAFRHVGESAVPLLKNALENESAAVRAKVADALGAIGPEAKPAVPNLVAALKDPDRNVRQRVVTALDSLGDSASDAVPALIQVMQNPRVLEPTRQLALKVLVRGVSGKQRKKIVAALEESAKDDNYGIRSLAASFLKRIKAETRKTAP